MIRLRVTRFFWILLDSLATFWGYSLFFLWPGERCVRPKSLARNVSMVLRHFLAEFWDY